MLGHAVAESFFATIKAELLDQRACGSKAGTTTGRRHSTLDYVSPAAYEATFYTNGTDRKVAYEQLTDPVREIGSAPESLLGTITRSCRRVRDDSGI
jgi:hypothetical protein